MLDHTIFFAVEWYLFTNFYCLLYYFEQKREKYQCKRSIIPTVQLMRTGFCPNYDNEQHCYRGLEHFHSREHIEQRRLKRKRIINSVLETQAKQRSTGITDPLEIATVYANIALCSKQQAAQFGRQDAFVSMQLYRKQFIIAPYSSGNAVFKDVDTKDEKTFTQIYTLPLPSVDEHLERIRSNKKRRTLRTQKELTPYELNRAISTHPKLHMKGEKSCANTHHAVAIHSPPLFSW
jgi:hypothetical protein